MPEPTIADIEQTEADATGRAHLITQSLLGGTPRNRVDELLEFVGLGDAGRQLTGEYSLGMRQRLAVATALLGEPNVLVLDEPANGLDPAGMAWLRGLLREHAAAGGTVLISSHLLGELELMVDDVVIIADGRLRTASPLADLFAGNHLRVRGGDDEMLAKAFTEHGATVTTDGRTLLVTGLTPEQAGDIALQAQVPVYELVAQTQHLEDIFLNLAEAS
ncbi:ATP-binding cassette domain-containing protein [Actinoplanes sp. NBRC 101535]|uniref:ATP-binding cassette domain-containing protein n=1 Tax=Actinoplanes sp. NBRC 101535 TaxID=3032196 RepID=UPI0024A351C9|nr:ATP-binding cassette domain-containing protein [Actinoplanes sp. NBRC 101535]GLY06510.1 hypothetical protein Acsp01_68890 [Actinoplanes sp. NBRC 101535]